MLDNTALTLLIEKKLSVNCLHLIIKNAFCIIIGKGNEADRPLLLPSRPTQVPTNYVVSGNKKKC